MNFDPLILLWLYHFSSKHLEFSYASLSGEAEAIIAKAQATAKGLAMVSQALKENGGLEVRFSVS